MERLTGRYETGLVYVPQGMVPEALDRLAYYEDLEEQGRLVVLDSDRTANEATANLCIRYMKDYADFHGYASWRKVKAHILRLLQAEHEERLVVLPCKVVCGTEIWWADSTIHTEPVKCEVCSFGVYSGFDGRPQVWMNCYVYGPDSRSIRVSDIGKTVFLTREEAEQALSEKVYEQVQDVLDRHNKEAMRKIAEFIEPAEGGAN